MIAYINVKLIKFDDQLKIFREVYITMRSS